MNILLLGGTRLLGRALVDQLATNGHTVTVISRRSAEFSGPVESIVAERNDGLSLVAGRQFDGIVDFLAYDAASVTRALTALPVGPYILVSSVWMVRLNERRQADAPIAQVSDDLLRTLPGVTQNYLIAKLGAERMVIDAVASGRAAAIMRFPIFWGPREHTGRIRFYGERAKDDKPIILVDGGQNLTQIGWTSDLATALVRWLERGLYTDQIIWEALPHDGVPVASVIAHIARGEDRAPVLRSVSSAVLRARLPAYLDTEPLWRERTIAVTDSNVFVATRTSATAEEKWLPVCARDAGGDPRMATRREEIALIEAKAQ